MFALPVSAMRTWFVEAGSAAWTEALSDLRHDVYHLPEYQLFAARWHYSGQPLLFVAQDAENRFVLPLIVRELPAKIDPSGELRDAISSRFFPGPLVKAGAVHDLEEFARRAIDALILGLASRGIVSAFVRVHPLLLPPLPALETYGSVMIIGDAVPIDLTLTDTEFWQQTRHNHRRDINKARRLGFEVRQDETWNSLEAFTEIYCETMTHVNAADIWRLPPIYFRDLRDALGEHVHLLVAELDGELAAGAILTEADGIVEYHLAATADRYRHLHPSKLLINEATRWAWARGNRVLNLAGSVRRGDSLNHFKLGFSPIQRPMYAWRLVADPHIYAALVEIWESLCGAASDPDDPMFPAYRRPMPSDAPASPDIAPARSPIPTRTTIPFNHLH